MDSLLARVRYGRVVLMIVALLILAAIVSLPAFAFFTSQTASLVIGQSSFTSSTCSGGFTSFPPTQSGLCFPVSSVFDSSGNLWVADTHNNRVLEFTKVTPPADFSVSASPSNLSVKRGNSTTVAITLASLNGFTGKVDLTATVAPLTQKSPGMAFSPASLTLSPGGTATSTLAITPANSPKGDGTYVITVTATSGSTTHAITVNLTVTKR